MHLDPKQRYSPQSYRIFLNGEDVTERCAVANDEHGVVCLYKTTTGTWPGAFYAESCCDRPGHISTDVAQEWIHGRVEIMPLPDSEAAAPESFEVVHVTYCDGSARVRYLVNKQPATPEVFAAAYERQFGRTYQPENEAVHA